MKLPANVLAKLCLTGVVASAGCETAVEFERRNAPPAVRPVAERIEVVEDLGELPAPAAAPKFAQPPRTPIAKPTPKIIKPRPAPKPAFKANACGPCGMG